MSGMIDLSGGAAAARGPTAGAPQSYELLDSDIDVPSVGELVNQ